MHSFRQTQTAITSYSMLHGGPWLAYETPVLGPSWSIPFEFPIYQLFAAALVWLTGIPLDSTGRLLSYGFLLLTLTPVRSLVRAYHLDRNAEWFFAVLLIASPLYLFWGTTFLIETLAVLLSFAFLAETARAVRGRRRLMTALAIVYGSLAVLCKITTFAPFYALAGLILVENVWVAWTRRQRMRHRIIIGATIMMPPPLLFLLWDHWADMRKMANPIGKYMIANTPMMKAWIFGAWSQLLSVASIYALQRCIIDTLGVAGVFILILLTVLALYIRFLKRFEVLLILAAVAAFLAPFGVFTNLHIVHNYYDAANAVFLLCAVAIVLSSLFEAGADNWRGVCLR
jgi:hypothetical protein